ncbi:MAG: bifunctional oligoribonuclease/PAP phosphatase NrnA [Candidatus Gracilibacteria bacterium]|nr:bifunctional oligoribonuclease/PAP phosphatase NrnA [Candidatus Gracilibacteria bacterium]
MLDKKLRVYGKIIDKITLGENIALISHKNPDLDTIGSATSFYEIIQDNLAGKNIDLICIDDIPEKYKFLKNTEKYKKSFNPKDYDLIIFFDSGSKSQTGFDQIYPELFDGKTYNTISIDHHITNELYAKQNILNVKYSSTTMIVFEIFYLLNIQISSISATNILAGIYTDTGGFKHSNVDNITYLIASELFELGADYKLIVDRFFKNNKLSTIKLWGKILSDSFIDENGVLYSYVNKSMLDSYSSDYDDISGVIDYLNTAENIKYCSLLTQKGEYIKASLRTLRDDIDLTQIAKRFDGGGHKKASGFTTKAQLEEIKSFNLKI